LQAPLRRPHRPVRKSREAPSLLLGGGRHEGGHGLSSSRSGRSRNPRSDASFKVCATTTGGTSFPTSVEERRSSTAGLHRPTLHPIRVIQPFHPSRIRLLRRNLRPLVGLLIACNTRVGGAPPNLDNDARPCPPQRSYVLPRLERVLLSRAKFARCHPFYSHLCVGEDCDPFRGRLSSRSCEVVEVRVVLVCALELSPHVYIVPLIPVKQIILLQTQTSLPF
jgi:hypothetical protein